MTDTTTPEAPVTEAGRVSARETMVHRLEAAVRRHGVTVAPNVWLDDLDAIEAEAVARDRERIAELEHAIDMIVIGLESERRDDDLGWHKFAAGYLRDARYPHPVVEEGREAQAGGPPPSSAALAATPSPAPTDREVAEPTKCVCPDEAPVHHFACPQYDADHARSYALSQDPEY